MYEIPIDQATNAAEHTITMHKQAESATVDVEVRIIQGSQFIESHARIMRLHKPTYFVELELDNEKKQTSGGHLGENGQHDWNESFIFTANRSSRLKLKLYCKHSTTRPNHVVGEATRDVWDVPRHENQTIDLHDADQHVIGQITLCLTIGAATVAFSAVRVQGFDLQSSYALNQMKKIVESLPVEKLHKFSPVWRRFIRSLHTVASKAQKLIDLYPSVQVALGAVTFALKMVLEQIDRDEKIERMVEIIDDLYLYVADTFSIEKIASYQETIKKLLKQTTECSYFIGDSQKVTQFAQRAVVNLVSDADAMIKKFENTFRDLKIELILGSSLQTAIVSFRVLQKVENIETLLYTNKLRPLANVGWDSGRTCFRGTRNAVINDLIQWASSSEESGTAKNNRVYVLQGPMGCGKSSIAHSVAQAFHLQNRLGAAIFLDERTEGKVIGSQILSITIASQLAAYDQNIREAIAAKIKADASLATEADVERQFRDLIVSATKGLALIGPICIIIDGLQKIVNSADQFRLLTAIADHFKKLPPNFRLLLTSERGRTSEDIAQLMPDCIIKEITFDDEGTIADYSHYSRHISQSLRYLFSKKWKLAEEYSIEDLRDRLIERSMGLYFWISTALQSLLLCAYGDECTILKSILSTELPRTQEMAMDQLYRIILTCIPTAYSICRTLIRSPKPLPLQDSSPDISLTTSQPTYMSPIVNMAQTLFIENGRDERANPLFSIHPSLEDFLTSSRRCHGTSLYVDRFDPTPSLTMVDICFDSMERGLRRNICRLDDIMALNEEIPNRDRRIGQYIPVMLRHACRNWMFHLEVLDSDSNRDSIASALKRLDTFLSKHLLHWIECMSLLGWVDVISTTLNRLSSWLAKHSISPDDVRYVLTMDAIQFIHVFAPIISKAAMQTYLSALPLISSVSPLLFSTYSAMSRPSIQLWRPRRSGCRIIHRPRAILSTVTLALSESAASFKDIRSGNKNNSSHAKEHYRCITFSPDGQWIATENKDQRGLDIWNVETLSHAKTIAKGCVELDFEFITYSADGKQVMIVPSFHSNISRRAFFIWDVETDKLVRRVSTRRDISKIAISPDQSQLAIVERYISHIRIIDLSTGRHMGPPIRLYGGLGHYSIDRLIWAPNGQFLATANSVFMRDFCERREIHLLSLSDEVANLSLGSPTPDQIIGLACSPDSSKVIAIYRDDTDMKHEKKLSIWCAQTGNLIATTSFEFSSEEVTIAFTPDEDILVCGYDLDRGTIVLLRFNVVPTHSTQTYTQYPPIFDPSEPPLTIAYSHDTSGVVVDYASHVDADGWILNTIGERQIWTPWANHELSHSRETPGEGRTEYQILEVKDPETKIVVLRYVIAFEDVN